ncbi:hypothetical protein J31TS3_22330 [Paenibacillus lactis]|nr:hypothetical protein J31TS3_22330 [Paenibacillus lactis]
MGAAREMVIITAWVPEAKLGEQNNNYLIAYAEAMSIRNSKTWYNHFNSNQKVGLTYGIHH